MNINVRKETPAKIKKLVFNLLDILKAIGIPVNNTDRKLERMAKPALLSEKLLSRSTMLYRQRDAF